MKEYLKMGDYFNADFQMNVPKLMSDDELYCGDSFVAEFTGRGQAIAAAHAINSHDELVEMNKELMELLVEAERYVRYRLEYTECDARIVMGLIANIEEAISKAKGGTA